MTKTTNKHMRAGLLMALIAVAVALVAVPSAFAADYTAGSVGAQADEDVVFTVYAKALTGFDAEGNAQYGDAFAAKTYTADELATIMVKKDAADAPGYNKYTKKSSTNTIYVATEYVTLDQLVKDAGVKSLGDDVTFMNFIGTFEYSDFKERPGELDDQILSVGNPPWSGMTGKEFAQDFMFFPEDIATQEIVDDAYAVPTVIAFKYGECNLDATDVVTAKAARAKAAENANQTNARLLFGKTIEAFEQEGPDMGNTSPSGIKGILIKLGPASIANAKVTLSNDVATYDGKAKELKVKSVIMADGAAIAADNYTVSYLNASKKAISASAIKNVGTYFVKVEGKGIYKDSVTVKFTIKKASQAIRTKLKVSKSFTGKKSGKTKVLAATKTFSLKKLANVSAKTTVKYAKKTGNKKITVDKKSGKVTVKKGLKKGSYEVTIKLTAAASANYTAAKAKTVTLTVKVK